MIFVTPPILYTFATPNFLFSLLFQIAQHFFSYMAASHFETGNYSAKSVFPCFDDPHFKANFTLTLIYPQSYVAISNTAEFDVTVSSYGSDTYLKTQILRIFFSNGYNIITFPTTPKMSTYLLAFCTGELTQLNTTASDGTIVGFTLFYLIFEKNVQIRAWAWQGMKEALTIPLQQSKEAFEWLSNFTGFKFPMNKLGKNSFLF